MQTGYTQLEAAAALGTSKGTIVNYEAGVRRDTKDPVAIPPSIQKSAGAIYALVHLEEAIDRETEQLDWLKSLEPGSIWQETVERPGRHDVTAESVVRQQAVVGDLIELRDRIVAKEALK